MGFAGERAFEESFNASRRSDSRYCTRGHGKGGVSKTKYPGCLGALQDRGR